MSLTDWVMSLTTIEVFILLFIIWGCALAFWGLLVYLEERNG